MYLLLLITAAAVLLSAIYLMLARVFTRILMHVTLVFSILLNMYALDCLLRLYADTEPTTGSGICVFYWVTRYYCKHQTQNNICVLIVRPASGRNYFYRHCSFFNLRVLGLQVAHTSGSFAFTGCHGCLEASYECIRCRVHGAACPSCLRGVSGSIMKHSKRPWIDVFIV